MATAKIQNTIQINHASCVEILLKKTYKTVVWLEKDRKQNIRLGMSDGTKVCSSSSMLNNCKIAIHYRSKVPYGFPSTVSQYAHKSKVTVTIILSANAVL